MEKKHFLKTKEGGLTVAFVIILLAFAVILTGLESQGDGLCLLGFIMMAAAMLYSPVKVFIIDGKK